MKKRAPPGSPLRESPRKSKPHIFFEGNWWHVSINGSFRTSIYLLESRYDYNYTGLGISYLQQAFRRVMVKEEEGFL